MTSDDRFGHLDRQWHPEYRPEPAAPARRPARRRRWPTRLAIVVLVLAGLFTAADRIAVGVAESQVAQSIQNSQGLAAKPSVTIDGFPFLTQVLGMRLGSVSLDARDIERNGIQLTDLRADARGVRLGGGFKPKSIDSLTGTAFLTWTDLNAAAQPLVGHGIENLTLAPGPGGTLKLSGTVFGMVGTAEGTITIGSGNRITVRTKNMQAGFLKVPSFEFSYAIGALPLRIRLDGFHVDQDGIRLTVSAADVPIN